jgi:hypothetical protein
MYFLSLDGMDHLLNLLVIAQQFSVTIDSATAKTLDVPAMSKQVLGCLADLLENPKALPLFHEWKCSKVLKNPFADVRGGKANALSILTAMWDQQSHLQSADQEGTESGDKRTDLRPPLYAVLSRVGFQNFSYATPEQASCLKSVSSYVALQRGTVFATIRTTLHEEAITPVPQDEEHLQSTLAQCLKTQMDTNKFQHDELAKVKQEQAKVLNAYYNKISERMSQCSEPIPEHINTHSTMGKRMAAKEMKEDMLKNSLDVEATLRRTAARDRGDADSNLTPEEEDKLENHLKLQGLA